MPSPGEERSVQNSRRRGKPSAGLTVQAAVAFPVGTMVVIDLRFPGQSFTYRSRGMVSWVTPSQRSNEQFNIGVLVFGMDKLDSGGDNVSRAPAFVSFSLAPDSPSASLESEPSPAYRRPQPQARRLRDSEPAPAWSELVRVRSAEPPRVSVAPRSTTARGSLVSLCAVDLKIARWKIGRAHV